MADRVPRAPSGLGKRGRSFWKVTHREYDLSDGEVELLTEACRTLDAIEALQASVDVEGVSVTGSAGQVAVHPAVRELRGQRQTLGRLLSQMGLEDADGKAIPSAASLSARKAAEARWGTHG